MVPGLFSPDEVRLLLDTFMAMHAGGPIPGCFMPKARLTADGTSSTVRGAGTWDWRPMRRCRQARISSISTRG